MGKIMDFQVITYNTTMLKHKRAVLDIPDMVEEVTGICNSLNLISSSFKALTTQDMSSSDFYDECNQVIEMCRNTSDVLSVYVKQILNDTLERINLVAQHNQAFAGELAESGAILSEAVNALGLIAPVLTEGVSVPTGGSAFADHGVTDLSALASRSSTYDGTANGKDISSVVSTGGSETNCFQYAWRQYNKIWGTNVAGRDDYRADIVANGVNVSAENLKAYLSQAPAGAMLRVDQTYDLGAGDIKGHSLIYLGENADGTGAMFAEGNIQGSSLIWERSYESLASWCLNTKGYNYIKYIAYPGANG